jgi:hypothetical protein
MVLLQVFQIYVLGIEALSVLFYFTTSTHYIQRQQPLVVKKINIEMWIWRSVRSFARLKNCLCLAKNKQYGVLYSTGMSNLGGTCTFLGCTFPWCTMGVISLIYRVRKAIPKGTFFSFFFPNEKGALVTELIFLKYSFPTSWKRLSSQTGSDVSILKRIEEINVQKNSSWKVGTNEKWGGSWRWQMIGVYLELWWSISFCLVIWPLSCIKSVSSSAYSSPIIKRWPTY